MIESSYSWPTLYLYFSDEDLSGDYLLAEAKFSIHKAISQATNKKFQLPLDRPNLKVI